MKEKKKKQKKAANKASGVPGWAFGLGLFALGGVALWLQLAPASPSPAGVSAPSAEWAPLISREHGFRMSMPTSVQDLAAAAGAPSAIHSNWVARHPSGTLMLSVTHCPKVCELTPDSVMKGAFEGAMREFGGTVLSQKPLQLPCPQGTCSGIEFEADTRQGLRITGRFFVSKDKLFQLLGTQPSRSNELFRQAADSFVFLE
jgi:hypothetical protein